MTEITEIGTERLILKSISPALIHELYATQTKQEIIGFFGFDDKGYEHFKKMHEQGMETFRFSMLFFLLIDKENNIPVGECGFHTWNTSHHRAELFYSLRNEADKCKGLMTEALKEVLHFGFHNMNLHRIEALVADWNIPSVKLLLRYGFTKEGTRREDYIVDGNYENSDCYSLLQWEWKNRRED
ncbi:MAG: GNAT family N-acetyltransferase [Chryseobacterium sp.]|jgi:ribosomal-protein-alanine N-acetyltransferase|uniref:GNAT family N-acetyltransferase n=1 Tax=Chryseobacterium sp. TaxID=1871047 RepID=UPI00282C199F|nr:GNAT family protein [Chryseobacterium sp.]MDR2234843.1 GNAT family N-acetyltransferase [Chryseobacterium sp.]